jgi:putative membrane protein
VQNFVAWWVVGFLMALIVSLALGDEGRRAEASAAAPAETTDAPWPFVRRLLSKVVPVIPALLYILSSFMFTVVNLARGYPLAGLVGVIFLGVAAAISLRGRVATAAAARRTAD